MQTDTLFRVKRTTLLQIWHIFVTALSMKIITASSQFGNTKKANHVILLIQLNL